MQTLCLLSLNVHFSTDRHFLFHAHSSIDRHSLLDAHLSIDMHPLHNAHSSIDGHSLQSMHFCCLLHTCSLTDTCSFRHLHLSLCTRPLMDTLLIVPLLWLTHFIQATLAWAVNFHESKLLWLTHCFRAVLVWYSILAPQCTRYTLVAHSSVTIALLHHLFSSIQLACVVWGICTFFFHVLCILHALCYAFHLSSLLSFMGSFAPHCHTSFSCHAFTV